MPMYEYGCPNCGTFEVIANISTSAEPTRCPTCQAEAPRVLSAPRLAVLSATQRRALERSEGSAHEPRRAQKHVCGNGCSHTHAVRQKRGKRPWMLGH